MNCTHISCGPPINESEQKAIEHLKGRLQSVQGEDEWILLSNLAFSINHQVQSDEVDIVVIGPPGVKVIEVKHWNPQWIKDHSPDCRIEESHTIIQEADRVTNKARKIGTTLRRSVLHLPHVEGKILLTWKSSEIRPFRDKKVRGVSLLSLDDWKSAVGLEETPILTNNEIQRLSRLLEPRSAIRLEGTLTRFAGLVNLKLQTPQDEYFHRVYNGSRSVQQDRVILHLYDLSAAQERNAEKKARREFEALHALQIYGWAPRILDSFQDAPGYPGEMFFFTLVDPAAPSLADRAADSSWETVSRIDFARKTVHALLEMHTAGGEDSRIVHRNLTAKTVRVRHDGTPIFTGFHLAKIPSDISVASTAPLSEDWEATASPGVRAGGLVAADQRSDVYSICASLRVLFSDRQDAKSQEALRILESGMANIPADRKTLEDLEKDFAQLLGESVPAPPPPPARFWSEEQIVRFRDHDYRIVTRLGSGGVGTTFKVIELEYSTKEELGTYVAKVAHNKERGERVLRTYNLARSHLGRHSGLSAIYEVTREWRENDFMALMTWIEGAPLDDFMGVFTLLAEDLQETGLEALAVRWLRDLCEALDTLHKNGLIHGDVSPRNIIVSGGGVVLTDYDFVTKIGEPVTAPGTMLYCSPSFQERRPASPSDDLYALGASFFHVLFEKEPFQYGGDRAKERGLNWEGINREEYPLLASFLNRATDPDPNRRFSSATEAVAAFRAESAPETLVQPSEQTTEADPIRPSVTTGIEPSAQAGELREERVEWLLSLLQSYPGSRWGNRETRGLDSPFAVQTYVETGLEDALTEAIRERHVRLVILCGNAGDGKTALLQHLAARLGFGEHRSAERILEHRLDSRLIVRMNLDGSAAWRGRSADQILDEFLGPFQQGVPSEDIAHLLAINDGRLLEWIEGVEGRLRGATPLTEELSALLQKDEIPADSHIRFISLNQRSLVGGITPDRTSVQAHFVENLLDRLYGGEHAAEIWRPCLTCSAQWRCKVFRTLKVFGPDNVPAKAQDDIRRRARERLIEALQAVHLRGEVHITARELRTALVFILFGLDFCTDYHQAAQARPLPYWDMAFDPTASGRQGEVLRELVRFDPALESHPQIDRHLLSEHGFDSGKNAPRYGPQVPLASARRRAFFEWTPEHLKDVARDEDALGLARGRHLRLFREIALDGENMNDEKRSHHCARLCRGISRLEDLPPQALNRPDVVPLRITPRTPTETAFWVEKPLYAFRLEADLPSTAEGLDRLHRQAWLIYRYRDGREERLRLGAELFHLLLELSEGYQLGDVSSDDTFAHLSIFVQRLAREDEREMLAWNPIRDEAIFRIVARIERQGDSVIQNLVLIPLMAGGHP